MELRLRNAVSNGYLVAWYPLEDQKRRVGDALPIVVTIIGTLALEDDTV